VESAIAQLAKPPLANEDPSTVLSEIDVKYFASLDCFKNSVSRLCDHKGKSLLSTSVRLLTNSVEITSDIHVYRFSIQKLVEYLRVKVERIATPEVFECCKTLIRGLAKQGLMEDGKEALLQCKSAKRLEVQICLEIYTSGSCSSILRASFTISPSRHM
jgi:ribonuclease H2 subunit B